MGQGVQNVLKVPLRKVRNFNDLKFLIGGFPNKIKEFMLFCKKRAIRGAEGYILAIVQW